MTLIAEDLLLLLLDDVKGSIAARSELKPLLGGAVLVELALDGAVDVARGGGLLARTRVYTQTEPDDLDPVLGEALEVVNARPRTAQALVNRLGKGLEPLLLGRLVDRGLLERREERMFGIFPRTRWPAAETTHEAAVRADLIALLSSDAPPDPDPRSAALVGLLAAVNRVHKEVSVPGLPKRELKRRAKVLAQGSWAAEGVREAVVAAQAAMTAVIVSSTMAASGS